MILYNDRIITNSVGKWFQRPLHMVTTHGNHGSVNANPNAGEFGTNVTLSNTPDTGYSFTGYTIAGDGASLSGNTLTIGYSDVSVTGNFGVNTYSITYSSVANGNFSGPSTAAYGSTVTITANPSSGYKMDYITVNGVRITGNTFTMPNGNVTISGAFVVDYNPYNLPANTIRVKVPIGYTPTWGTTQTQVSSYPNIWDIYDPGVSMPSGYPVNPGGMSWKSLFNTDGDKVLEILGANLGTITILYEAFSSLTNLTKVALFDTSSVTDMQELFYNCTSLTSVPLFDTSSVNNMTTMFMKCSALTTVPLFDTHNVTRMTEMFRECPSLITIPQFNTSNVTHMGMMFAYCGSLTTLPLLDTSKVTVFELFCADDQKLTRIPLFNTSSATNVRGAFGRCYKVEGGAYALYNQMINQTTPPATHSDCFYNCGRDTTTGAAELARIGSGWK